jgi:probable phosphoglycerate mutase
MKQEVDMPLHLYLIRHGETTWSLTHQHTGRTDIPLTEHGEEEARQLGKRLSGTKFARVFSSPSCRAQRTCALVGLREDAEIEPDLAEWNYGDYEGGCTADIRKGRPDWNIFRDGCPGGEMPGQVSDRADRLIAHLRKLDGKVALFSHGQFGCVLAARWIGLPIIDGPHFVLGTASLSVFGYDPDHPTVPVISLWNAFSHEMLELLPHPPLGDTRTLKERAIQRWETDGGEIPNEVSQNNGVNETKVGRPISR